MQKKTKKKKSNKEQVRQILKNRYIYRFKPKDISNFIEGKQTI